MNDSLLDDVKALLDKEFGDDRILKQICRACENNEVISNYERTYVEKLAQKHLGKRPQVTPTPTIEKQQSIPDVVIPETPSIQKMQTYQSTTPKTRSNSKNSKAIMGIAGITLVIIIAVAVSFSGTTDITTKVETPKTPVPITLSIQSDLASYNKKDLISISGTSNTSGTINLSIENSKNELVWAEQVTIKNNEQYSTLAIAGGEGWENSGIYTIKADNGKETKSITFSFKA
ncbi:hypothetical protein [Nitrosopumilus adriaticus]|uniref:hypothetical protein n=1 Tax=Nitrosopumilus adriaticus TaxID=1580092 RepID=UPI00352C4CB9